MKTRIMSWVRQIFSINGDRIPESEIIETISNDINFTGVRLWLLVIAILLASLGLNTNSTAVIIGAMLISPLMGPIIGVGFGIGTYDFELLRKSFYNYLKASFFSIVTATAFFFISPITKAQSELLARTSPTIYDVLIAFFGGMAGILALNCKSQKYGNVIPGVAIATALMPPLCTAGFGIANGEWHFALKAIYLYLINTVFIAFSTTLCIVFLFRFHKKTFVDKRREKKVRQLIGSIAICTIIPSVFITYNIVNSTIMDQRVARFLGKEVQFDGTNVVSYKINPKDNIVQVLLLGKNIDSTDIENLKGKLADYKLEGVDLSFIQGQKSDIENNYFFPEDEKIINTNHKSAKREYSDYTLNRHSVDMIQLVSETKILFPSVTGVLIADNLYQDEDTCGTHNNYTVIIEYSQLSDGEKEKICLWLRDKLKINNITFRPIETTDKELKVK